MIASLSKSDRTRLCGERSARGRIPPRLGEHTEEVLISAAYTNAEIKTLGEEGVIA
jgi:hypothetical protein